MSDTPYSGGTPVVTSKSFDTTTLKGKSVIVTGGASGLGEAFVRAFAKAGYALTDCLDDEPNYPMKFLTYLLSAYVTIADLNADRGEKLATELGKEYGNFVKCDVTSWSDQLAAFQSAVSQSPSKSCDIVVSNAGVSGPDPVFTVEDSEIPVEPDLKIVKTNCLGVLYTAKLATHYFNRQPLDTNRDRCLIFTGSIAGYLDQPGSPQYNVSKWGVRALMRNMRCTAHQTQLRVNIIAPWFIKTPIMSADVVKWVESKGVSFALIEDAVTAVLHLASDKSINGRSLGIVPKSFNENGYLDMEHDDYAEDDFLHEWQRIVLAASHRTSVPAHLQ